MREIVLHPGESLVLADGTVVRCVGGDGQSFRFQAGRSGMDLKSYFRQCRGRQADLARKIGVHAPDLARWASGRRPVPVHYCMQIEAQTNGAVTRQDLRPDDWQKYWPDAAARSGEVHG